MSVGRVKPLLGFTAVALLFAGGLAVLAAVRLPLAGDAPPAAEDDEVNVAALQARTADPLPLSSFARAWSLDLRRALVDAPRAPGTAQPVDAGIPVKLVGTILDPARPRGIFLTQLGQTELKAAGEKVAGVEVLAVEERSATLSIAGRAVTIKVEKVEPVVPAGPDPAQPPSARAKVR
jgi:hypothetical protein